MREHRIPIEVLLDIVETGTQLERDAGHCWIRSLAADGDLVEVVFLDAVKERYFTPAADGQKAA